MFQSCEEEFHAARAASEVPYADRFRVDEEQLLAYLRRLGPAADHALRDGLNRWQHQGLTPDAAGFTQAGFRVVPEAAAAAVDGSR